MDNNIDLNITLYENHVPDIIIERLPALYKSYFSVIGYLQIYMKYNNLNALVFTSNQIKNENIMLFTVNGNSIKLLNQVLTMIPESIEIFSRYIFKKYPQVHRIYFEFIKTDIHGISLPLRYLSSKENFVIDLPDCFGSYVDMLGKPTSKNIKRKLNGLKKKFLDFSFNIIKDKDITKELIHRIIVMNRARMRSINKISGLTDEEEDKIFRLAQKYGVVTTIHADNRDIAGQLCYKIGDSYHAHISSYDMDYNYFSPGLLIFFLTIELCINTNAEFYSLGWGDYRYKRDLLAKKQTLYHFVIFRTLLYKLVCWESMTIRALHFKEKIIQNLKTSLKKIKTIAMIYNRIFFLINRKKITTVRL
jgi:CelD/BcsL family acetyltransferase involved in cellulose biosynthesis